MRSYLKYLIRLVPAIFLIAVAVISFACSPLLTATPPSTSATPPTASPTQPGNPLPTASFTPSVVANGLGLIPNWQVPALSTDPLPADLSGIASQILPSVVSINAEVTTTDIFGNPTTQQGAGSGWVIDSNGIIVTNNHVIQDAQNVNISTPDGRNFPAQQILADPLTDLAVIKINATGLQAVKLGDSNKLRQGMMVAAIGNSLGQGIRVSAGWVSRLSVSLTMPTSPTEPGATLFDLIEVTAPINPGNSGGPLVDMLGEVVGITNAKLVASGVEAVGYAISTQTALPILQQLIQNGQVIRPYLGTSFLDVTPMLASVYGFAVNRGAIIIQVDPGSPAAGTGLRPGDIITEINNRSITSAADALRAILTSQIGQQLSITYYRGNTQSTVQIRLVQNPTP